MLVLERSFFGGAQAVVLSKLKRGLWILPDVWMCGELWSLLERAHGLRVESGGAGAEVGQKTCFCDRQGVKKAL